MLKIVQITRGNPLTACPMLRLYSPLTAMHTQGLAECRTVFVREDESNLRDCIESTAWADVVVVQRMFPWKLIRLLLGSGLSSKAVVYDIDDDLLDIPPEHVLAKNVAAFRSMVLPLVRWADAVTVTTPLLAERMKEYNRRVLQLPNFLDEAVWPCEALPVRGSETLTVGYAGTFTHQTDIAFVMRLLSRLRAKYPGRLKFSFFGCAPKDAVAAPDTVYIDGGLDYPAYAKTLRDARYDIAIAPLEETPFNRVKSNIKYLEYARCRIAGVYARLDPYTCVREGETGMFAMTDPDDWFAKICVLIDDASLRRRIADAAYDDVAKNHMLHAHAGEWLAVYEDALRFVRNGRVRTGGNDE